MTFFSGPRSLKSELQILFLCIGSAFLVLATILLFQNGQAALRRQILGTATTAAETAASLIAVEDHQAIRTPADMNTPGFRTIVTNLGALRRANPSIYHLFTLAPLGQLGRWGVVVDMGGTAPVRDESELRRGRLPIGSPPPPSVPPALIVRGMSGTNAEILDITHPDRARVVALAPIRTVGGAAVGLVVVELSASSLIAEARLLWYVSIGVFLLGLVASVIASTFVSRWVTRPIENLLKGVEEIARGNLSARVATDLQANELGSLAGAFNHMAEGLEVSQKRNTAHQSRLHQLHQLGSNSASSLDVPTILELAAGGLLAICGGAEAYAGASTRREPTVRLWAASASGSDRPDTSSWTAPLDRLSHVLGGESRLLERAEFRAAGLECLESRPGACALVAPLRVSDEPLGLLVVLGDRGAFHDDSISVASLFAAQVSAAVSNARNFEQLKALDRSKSEFLSIASHEMRTPLTVMKSSLDILTNTPQFTYNNDQMQMMAFCQESVERLIGLVRDILDISRIEAGVLSLQLTPTSLNDLIEKCLHWVPQLPGGQGVELDARLPSVPAMVMADANRISQVLDNVVSNAIKFSKPGGKVSIEVRPSGDDFEVVVTDQGKGIAAEDLERIFGKFYQVEEATTREQGGTGLGLAICRGIIEAHRGKIWAESDLGHGSHFHFTLARWADISGRDPRDTRVSVPSLLSSLRSAGRSPTRSRD
ncbi:MAG: ATP-binding protein [Candidatus Eiseniibacteriota bacterium]